MGMSCFLVQSCMHVITMLCFSVHFCSLPHLWKCRVFLAPAEKLSDPNSTSFPAHPGTQYVAMSCLSNFSPLPTQACSANSKCEACQTYTTQAACPNPQCLWTGSTCEATNCTKHRFWGCLLYTSPSPRD